MKLLRFFLLNAIILFLIVLLISFFIPSRIRISRAVNMAPYAGAVLKEVSDINNWKYWYPGFDTIKVQPLQTIDGRLIVAKIPGTTLMLKERGKSNVFAEFKSKNDHSIISGWQLVKYSATDSLTLQWYMDFKLNWYPWEKFTSLLYEKAYGTQMEIGLQKLKKIVER